MKPLHIKPNYKFLNKLRRLTKEIGLTYLSKERDFDSLAPEQLKSLYNVMYRVIYKT